ncbi:UNVERIFIED_CONTAM: hypothetical protein FKN15_015634 [Acipenser sinensis]
MADILLECRYPRRWNVSSSPIKPTWVPFTSTASTEQILDFSLLLMNGMKERITGVVPESPMSSTWVISFTLRLLLPSTTTCRCGSVDSCIATLSNNKDSEPRYAVVDKLGCLMDSKSPDSSSSFIRPALNKLRFDITAFKFQGDSRSMVRLV